MFTAMNYDFSADSRASAAMTHADFTQAGNYSIRISGNKIKDAKFSMPEAVSLLYCLGIKII